MKKRVTIRYISLYWLLPLFVMANVVPAAAQAADTSVGNALLQRIAAMQVTEDTDDFFTGMFPTYRRCQGWPHHEAPDNSIYFTGITAFTLRNLLPALDKPQQEKVSQIIICAQKAYSRFGNKQGLPVYYFWPAGGKVMPHSLLVKLLSSKLATSEDIDDTVILLMAMDAPDSLLQEVKVIMEKFANTRLHTIRNSYRRYKSIPAYSTWLGPRMLVDFDLSVLTNVLYFVMEHHFSMNRYDSATLSIIGDEISRRLYLSDPAYASSYYVRPPVILYHIARLMSRFSFPLLEPYRRQLITDMWDQLHEADNIMDKIILSTSLIRMGEQPPLLPTDNLLQQVAQSGRSFVFYQARAGSQMRNPLKRLFLDFPYLNYNFYSQAYNDALALEYLVLREKGKAGE